MKGVASYILRVVLFVLLFLSIKDDVLAQTGFGMGNTLKPVGASEFPIVLSNQVMGGHHQVATIAERDAIFSKRRQVGMLCTVLDDGSGATKIYQLLGGVANANWVELSTGGNGTVPSGDTVPADGADAGSTFYQTNTNILWVSDGTIWKEVGTGTVKTVSVVTANGVSGTVDDETTAPKITITLSDITPSSIDVSGTLKMHGAVYGAIRQHTVHGANVTWTANDFMVVLLYDDIDGFFALPTPASAGVGRILSIYNSSTSAIEPTAYDGIAWPVGATYLEAKSGYMVISDGTTWHLMSKRE